MRTKLMLVLFLAWAGASGLQAAEPNKTVAVLYFGATPVNSDTLHFLEHQSKDAGYTLVPTQDPQSIQPGKVRAVVLLNTDLAAGVDRRFVGFINSWENKGQIVLVSLRKGAPAGKVETFAPSPATLGVDAVTAASKWEGRGSVFGTSDAFKMHLEWSNQVLTYIGQLP